MQELLDVLEKRYYPEYLITTEQAERWTRQVTGIGLNEELKRFNRRESEEEYEQRVRLTIHISKSISNKVANGFKKPFRASGVKEVIKGENAVQLKTIVNDFTEKRTFTEVLGEVYLRLNLTDPNAVLLLDVNPFDPVVETPKAKLIEIPSENVLYYEEEDDVVVHLIFSETFTVVEGDELIEKIGYYSVTPDSITKLRPVPKDEVPNIDSFRILTEESEYFYSEQLYAVETVENNLGYVPAMRPGYLLSITTKGLTYESIIEVAMPYYLKMLDSNSEFDLANRLHAFPQKVGYYPRCVEKGCVNGQTANGDKCKTCKGTSYMIPVHSSTQDFIGLPYPKNGEEAIDVTKLFTYITVDTSTMEYQRGELTRLEEKILDCIFNNDIYSKVTVEKTATETNSKKDNVNDTLYFFAQGFAQLWKFFVEALADYNGIHEDTVSVQYIFPNDFKLETLDELIENYKVAVESNAPAFLVNQIAEDIARKIYADDPVELEKFRIAQMINPFAGESAEVINAKLTFASSDQQYLYANLGQILQDIEAEDPDYYLNLEETLRRVQEKVREGRGLIGMLDAG